MNKPKAVFPGSFDPFSLAHHELVINASELFDVTILICVNPEKSAGMFTPEERCQIIKHAFREYYNFVNVEIYSGLVTDYCKSNNIEYIIRGFSYTDAGKELDLCHIYYDDSEDDRKLKTIFFPTYNHDYLYIRSTRIREYIKNNKSTWEQFVPTKSINVIHSIIDKHKNNK